MQRYHLHSVVEACDKSIKLNPRYVKALCRRMKAHHSLDQNSETLLGICRFLLYACYCMASYIIIARLLLNRYDTLLLL